MFKCVYMRYNNTQQVNNLDDWFFISLCMTAVYVELKLEKRALEDYWLL
jgi:hypothetical protein